LEQFAGVIASSAWWREVTAGYRSKLADCIGDGRAVASAHVGRALPVDARDSDIDSLLLQLAQQSRLGLLDAETVLVVYLAQGVKLTDSTAKYCRGGPRAFHRAIELEGQSVAYAVLPRCGDEAELTGSASHGGAGVTSSPASFRNLKSRTQKRYSPSFTPNSASYTPNRMLPSTRRSRTW
jgi:hypothetical protein